LCKISFKNLYALLKYQQQLKGLFFDSRCVQALRMHPNCNTVLLNCVDDPVNRVTTKDNAVKCRRLISKSLNLIVQLASHAVLFPLATGTDKHFVESS